MQKKSGQVWFTDFVIAMLIFSFALIYYYTFTTNISKQDSVTVDNLVTDSKSISSSLLVGGFPSNWDNTTVQRIGVTDDNQILNPTKWSNFDSIGYNKSKKLFGTAYDYLAYFVDENDTLLNILGICGIGVPEANFSYDIKAAYYYDNDDDSFIKDFMIDKLDADVYSAEPGYEDFDVFISNLTTYGIVLIEHSKLTGNIFDDNKAAMDSFVSNGGLMFLSGQIANPQGRELTGVKLYKKNGQSLSDRNSTVVKEDEFLDFTLGESIVFRQAYYVENLSTAKSYTEIVKFVEDDRNAVSRWNFGNGSVFHFSDLDVSFFSGDFVDEVQEAIKKWGNFKCNPINISNLEYQNLIKIDRFLVYDSKPVKMVLYLWD